MSIFLRAYRLLRADVWTRTAFGERLFLAAFFAYKKWLEDPHAAFVARHAEALAGGHVLDVGANVGYTATLFARAVSPGFRVCAFEPEPLNFARLERVIARRRLNNVVAVRTAVGDVDGSVSMARNPDHPGDHRVDADGELTVPITRLDTFARELTPVKFVKMDVQGHELAVSRGMTQLLERNPALEISFEYSGSKELAAFYLERGFRLRLIGKNGSLLPFEDADAIIRKRGYCDIFASRSQR